MTRRHLIGIGLALLAAALAPLSPARADFEVAGPDGRRIVLKDDGTWRYADAAKSGPAGEKSPTEFATLTLERRVEVGPNCRFGLRLSNELPYEIRNIVPYFSVYRPGGVKYDSRGVGFFSIKPGNSAYREIEFQGITCQEIARLQVSGGDRCVMGDLDKFSSETGACLDRVRLAPSDLLRFDK